MLALLFIAAASVTTAATRSKFSFFDIRALVPTVPKIKTLELPYD